MIFEHITHSLGKDLWFVFKLVQGNWGNTSGVLVNLRYTNVLKYCQVIYQISNSFFLGGGDKISFFDDFTAQK